MQQHRKTAEISTLILVLALVTLLFTACGNEPTPTTVNIAASTTASSTAGTMQSPTVITPPVTPLQKGKLKEVFPALANLENEVVAIEVDYDNSHYNTRQAWYKLERKGNNFEGEATYRADNWGNGRTSPSSAEVSLTKKVIAPFDAIKKHLSSIVNDSYVELGSYKGQYTTTYVAGGEVTLSIIIYTNNAKLYYTNKGASFRYPYFAPWDGDYNGNPFFIEKSEAIGKTVQALNGYANTLPIFQDLTLQYIKKKNSVTP